MSGLVNQWPAEELYGISMLCLYAHCMHPRRAHHIGATRVFGAWISPLLPTALQKVHDIQSSLTTQDGDGGIVDVQLENRYGAIWYLFVET